jgi:iron(III) transport system substrate-binding protein
MAARSLLRLWCVGVALVVAAGCSPPTTELKESGRFDGYKKATADRLVEIESELEGLDPKARRQKLTELALAEGGTVTIYGVTSLDDMSEQIDAFEEATGLTVNYFRAGHEDVLQRVLEEAKAEFRGADAVNENGAEMAFIDNEGLLAPLDTPVAETTTRGDSGNWLWGFIDIYSAAWNTDLVSPAEAPKTWEDVLTNYEGQVLIDSGDVEWFATLVEDYFMAEKGMTEDEALDLFRDAAKTSTFVDGHTFMADLVAAGEYKVAASPFRHGVIGLMGDDAPLAWEPAVEPLVARPEGMGVHATAEHPASGLLFVEWYVTDGQAIGQGQDRQPASSLVKGGGLPSDYESIVVDPDVVVEDYDKWLGFFNELIELSGEDVIVEE